VSRGRIRLLAIVALAAGLRLWGIDFGLPETRAKPDEHRIVDLALGFFSGDYDPGSFQYPSLYLYALHALYLVYFALGRAFGLFTGAADFVAAAHVGPTPFFLIARCLSAGLGALTVAVLHGIVLRLSDRRAADLSAFFLAVAYLHVRESHFGVTDVAMTFLVSCSTLALLVWHERGALRAAAAAGALAGLAASTKYSGAMLIAPAALSALARAFRSEPAGDRWRVRWLVNAATDRGLLLFTGALILAFFAGTPFALADLDTFLRDVRFEMRHLEAGHAGIQIPGGTHHLFFSLRFGLGAPLLLAGLVGLVAALARDPLRAGLVFGFPLIYFGVAARGSTAFARYMVPVVPFLCAAAGLLAADLLARGARRHARLGGALVASVLALALALPSLVRAIQLDRLLAREDSRGVASRWFHASLPAGSSVFQAAQRGTLSLGPTQASLREKEQRARQRGEAFRAAVAQAEIARRERALLHGYEEWRLERRSGRFVGRRAGALPQYVIVERSPLQFFSAPPANLDRMLASHFRLRREFVAGQPSKRNRYDPQEAFYLPYAGFAGIDRPGPDILLYERWTEDGP
jgi:4-amino-4-deoxy-L-arabinose transferase-like glycosyltransferase